MYNLSQLFFFKKIFIYLAASGLSCSMWDFHCVRQDLSLQHTDALEVRRRAQVCAGFLVPRPGLEPTSSALQGKFSTLDHQGSPRLFFFTVWH